MAKKKEQVETSSATLDSGTRIHGPKEVVDRVAGNGDSSGSTTSTRSKTTAK